MLLCSSVPRNHLYNLKNMKNYQKKNYLFIYLSIYLFFIYRMLVLSFWCIRRVSYNAVQGAILTCTVNLFKKWGQLFLHFLLMCTCIHQTVFYCNGSHSWVTSYQLVVRWYSTHSLRSFVKYCFHHSKIKFISSHCRVISST